METDDELEEFEYKTDDIVDDKIKKDIDILKTIYGRGEALNNKVYELLEKAEVIHLKYIANIMGFVCGNFINYNKILNICQNKLEHISEAQFFKFLYSIPAERYFLCQLYSMQYVCLSTELLCNFLEHIERMHSNIGNKEKFMIFVKDKLAIHTWIDFELILLMYCNNNSLSNNVLQIMLQRADFNIEESHIIINDLFDYVNCIDSDDYISILAMFINFYETSNSLELLINNKDCKIKLIKEFCVNTLAKIAMQTFTEGFNKANSTVAKYLSTSEIYDRNVLKLIYNMMKNK